jgi:NAD(P)-dependent dehydrogenase (short-subunit alcohol dehydrogenase family)
MSRNLVFITGGSSGIGLALAESVPFESAHVYDISRRGSDDFDHVAADLANPESWDVLGEFFVRELEGFGGERAILFHCAATLDPIGFAGEVKAEPYKRNVLLNSAAPQVLGDAFLDAARRTRARCHLIFITSGAAGTVYEGWSSYGAGKAAVDQWVRTAGAEQARRGNHCRVLSVAPGTVATAMQTEIRMTPADRFPQVAKFRDLFEHDQLRDPGQVARELWALLDRDLPNGAVVDLRELGD